MEYLHTIAAMFAAFRLTTLFTIDAIWIPIRRRFPKVPWSCSLCMSVWAGAAATAFVAFLPWLNWPLALSWAWLAYSEPKPQPKPETRMNEQQRQQIATNAYTAELKMAVGEMAQRCADLRAQLEVALNRVKELEATAPAPADKPALQAIQKEKVAT